MEVIEHAGRVEPVAFAARWLSPVLSRQPAASGFRDRFVEARSVWPVWRTGLRLFAQRSLFCYLKASPGVLIVHLSAAPLFATSPAFSGASVEDTLAEQLSGVLSPAGFELEKLPGLFVGSAKNPGNESLADVSQSVYG